MKKSILLAIFLIASSSFTQNNIDVDTVNVNEKIILEEINPYNPLSKPNTYTNPDNPNYWKNKMPYPGYWQQDVHYIIDAEIVDTLNMIKATQQLIYTNNSPDDLKHVFFHLYANAFEPDSYLDKFRKLSYKK